MINDFLRELAEVNLAIAAGVLLLLLLRWPLRKYFGAQIAYTSWLLVPAIALATLIPARTIVFKVSPLRLADWSEMPARTSVPIQDALVLAAWAAGALLLLGYFTRAQMRFHAAMRDGNAGPAVAGVLRPQIVTPSAFFSQFSADEQTAILAHERTHLSRQDARINAAVALLRCFCWFNPLAHTGARLMRIDQEMACDAAVLSRHPGMRRVYAEALLKTQMTSKPLPLGCYWPGGTDHPLMERIAMLKVKHPNSLRRMVGVTAILAVSGIAGWGAWAAQSPRVAVVMDGVVSTKPAVTLAQNAEPRPAPTPRPAPASEQTEQRANEQGQQANAETLRRNYEELLRNYEVLRQAYMAEQTAREKAKMTEGLAREQSKLADTLASKRAEMAEKQAELRAELALKQAEVQTKLQTLRALQETRILPAVSKIVSDALLLAGNTIASVKIPQNAAKDAQANHEEYERAIEKAMEESFGPEFEKRIEAEVERALKASGLDEKDAGR